MAQDVAREKDRGALQERTGRKLSAMGSQDEGLVEEDQRHDLYNDTREVRSLSLEKEAGKAQNEVSMES
ncbi:uncharacterized protein N7484_004557 [Penicillium longicatenatum]|uniref:uncharacterized protein n=1 Tax=Penicillium longicatenatum TaxID=1561947 RepID=UPI002548EA23|nr:uncharacterized protein N7484_004557 [Penicillium longicatenatum]KAJ5650834.1 hypothetical protein N7484_004557 [Penicillium longicatenatum]